MQVAREVVRVRLHVEVPMSTQVEQDGLASSFSFASQRFDDGSFDRVCSLRRGQDAFGATEQHAGFESLRLLISRRLNRAEVRQMADQRGHAVVTKSACVHARRDKR